MNYTAEASVPKEIERNLQISDNILRYLTVKVEERRSNVKPRPVRVAPVAEEAAPTLWRRPPLPKPKLLLRLNNHREGYE